jgi:hypothetical protein
MAYYFKYNFISPESVYAIVLEELKSYMDTGSIDSLLFPTYVDKCLKKLGRSSYVIQEEMLFLEDFEARLPDNFYAVREAWLCAEVPGESYQSANSFYSQTSSMTIQIAPMTIGGTPCNNPACQNSGCDGNCQPEGLMAVYKTNTQMARTFHKEYLLKPGNISARKNCDVEYTALLDESERITNHLHTGSSGYDSFDIRDNKFVTNFRNGQVYLIFYATDYDEIGNQLIPDNYAIIEFIEAFLKFKCFEVLTNQTNDETFNQLQQKLQYYEQSYNEKFILASTEIKKQTVHQKQRNIKRQLNSFRMYELPNRVGWRR